MEDDKVLMMDRFRPGQSSEEPSHEGNRQAELALFRSLAAATLAEGRSRVSSDTLTGDPLTATDPGLYPFELSEMQYTALQEVGGVVMLVVKDQRLIIARTAVDAYVAYTTTCPR